MTKSIVIYHSADFDGIFCREIARKFLPDAELIGWNFGDPNIPLHGYPAGTKFYVLDLPVDLVFFSKYPAGLINPFIDARRQDIVWIDHHKTSIETHPTDIPGYRIDGVAACRLAWQWFNRVPYPAIDKQWCELPCKEFFIDRTVREPRAVRLAGEYDVFDKRDPDAETFQFGLRSRPIADEDWKWLLTPADGMTTGEYALSAANVTVASLLQDGRVAQRYQAQVDRELMESRAFMLHWEGLKWICVNTGRFNSQTFAFYDRPERGHDALLGFCWNGRQWIISLYHAKHRTDMDLSEIAQRYGGGGHRGACGFASLFFPFDAHETSPIR